MLAWEADLDEQRSGPAKRIGFGALAFLALALALWILAYATGAFPWLGYAWLNDKSLGAGPVTVIGRTATARASASTSSCSSRARKSSSTTTPTSGRAASTSMCSSPSMGRSATASRIT